MTTYLFCGDGLKRVAGGGREKGPDRLAISGPGEGDSARLAAGGHPMGKALAFTIAGPVATKLHAASRRRARRRGPTGSGAGRKGSRDHPSERALCSQAPGTHAQGKQIAGIDCAVPP